MKADHSFMVNIESFSHLSNKDHLNPNSRIMKSTSRKGSDNKMSPNCLVNDGDGDAILSPKASLVTGTMPEKLRLVDLTTDQINNRPQVHHQITIMTGGTTVSAVTAKPPGTPTKTSSTMFWKRSRSFKHSSIINPTRILILFATMSSIGTVLLICLTLSMSRYNEDDNSHA